MKSKSYIKIVIFFFIFFLLGLAGLSKVKNVSAVDFCFTNNANDCVLPGGHDQSGVVIPCQSCGCAGTVPNCYCNANGTDARGKLIYGTCQKSCLPAAGWSNYGSCAVGGYNECIKSRTCTN